MGKVEELRKKQSGTGKVETGFKPDPEVEKALMASVKSAQNNLRNYRKRVKAYKEKDR